MKTPNKEQIYDEKISPLMAQIIAICKEHRIAFVADFSVPNDEDTSLKCTSALLEEDCEPGEEQLRVVQILRPRMTVHHSSITVRDADGNVVSKDLIATLG